MIFDHKLCILSVLVLIVHEHDEYIKELKTILVVEFFNITKTLFKSFNKLQQLN